MNLALCPLELHVEFRKLLLDDTNCASSTRGGTSQSEIVYGTPIDYCNTEDHQPPACTNDDNRHYQAEHWVSIVATLKQRPEVLEAHRLAGDIDYILKVRVKNAKAYDAFYQALISEVRIFNVTALLSMEEIKSTTVLAV